MAFRLQSLSLPSRASWSGSAEWALSSPAVGASRASFLPSCLFETCSALPLHFRSKGNHLPLGAAGTEPSQSLWVSDRPLHRETHVQQGHLCMWQQCFCSVSSLIPLSPYRYHKVLKKGKAKQALKEFEKLRKVNPAAALEELEKLEKARMMVRQPLAPNPWSSFPRKTIRISLCPFFPGANEP